jgi:hypothetical protein
MAVMLITYDDGIKERAVDRVLGIIKSYNHIQLSENTFAIVTFEKTCTIFNKIMPLLGKSAHFFVVTVMKPFAGPVRAPTSEWFMKYLTEE